VHGEGLVDGGAQRRRVPRAAEEREVERGVDLVLAQVRGEPLRVGQPHLADQRPWLGVAVGDRAPRPVHLVHLVAVLERMRERWFGRVEVGEPAVLHQQRGRVDADAVGAPVEPEPQHVLELLADLRVFPVEVRLLGREQVQVPLAGRTVRVGGAGPGRAAEDGLPVVGRQLAGGAAAGTKPEQVARGRAGPVLKRFDKPRVLVRAVVRHHVHDDPDAERVRLPDQLLGLGERTEDRVDRPVVGDVVTGVRLRGGVPRAEPHGIDAEAGQVVEVGADAAQIADAVTVAVGETARIDLVDDGRAPPFPRRRAHLLRLDGPDFAHG
jgi:hypothetical protein